VTNLAIEPSAAIHVYLGDLSAQRRSLWTLDLDHERPFDEESYFARARQRTSLRAIA
jgi:predicted metal-dependent enzyme (double-stranded beta helix superfamily)